MTKRMGGKRSRQLREAPRFAPSPFDTLDSLMACSLEAIDDGMIASIRCPTKGAEVTEDAISASVIEGADAATRAKFPIWVSQAATTGADNHWTKRQK